MGRPFVRKSKAMSDTRKGKISGLELDFDGGTRQKNSKNMSERAVGDIGAGLADFGVVVRV